MSYFALLLPRTHQIRILLHCRRRLQKPTLLPLQPLLPPPNHLRSLLLHRQLVYHRVHLPLLPTSLSPQRLPFLPSRIRRGRNTTVVLACRLVFRIVFGGRFVGVEELVGGDSSDGLDLDLEFFLFHPAPGLFFEGFGEPIDVKFFWVGGGGEFFIQGLGIDLILELFFNF